VLVTLLEKFTIDIKEIFIWNRVTQHCWQAIFHGQVAGGIKKGMICSLISSIVLIMLGFFDLYYAKKNQAVTGKMELTFAWCFITGIPEFTVGLYFFETDPKGANPQTEIVLDVVFVLSLVCAVAFEIWRKSNNSK